MGRREFWFGAVVLMAALSVGSCSPSQEEQRANKDPIVGTWTLFSVTSNGVRVSGLTGSITFTVNHAWLEIGAYRGISSSANGTWANTGTTYSIVTTFQTAGQPSPEVSATLAGGTLTLAGSNVITVYKLQPAP